MQLAESVNSWQPADHFILIGSGTDVFRRVALDHGVNELSMVSLEGALAPEIAAEITRRAGDSAVVMGMGNTAGVGIKLFDHFHQSELHQPVLAAQSRLQHDLQEAA